MQITTLISAANYNASSNSLAKTKAEESNAKKDAERSAALNILKSANTNKKGDDVKKAHAKQRLQEIAKMIEILKKMYAGDPKKLAKVLAGLVKEIKSLVKQFGDSLGSGTSISTANTPTANDTNSETVDTAEIDTDSVNAGANSAEAITAQTQPQATTSDTAKTDDKTADINQSQKTSTGDESNNEIKQFAKEVRELMRKIKEIFQKAKGQLEIEKSFKSKKEIEEDEQAIKEFEDAEKELNQELSKLEGSVTDTSLNGSLVSLVA